MDSPTWEISGNPLDGSYFFFLKSKNLRNCTDSDPLFIDVRLHVERTVIFYPLPVSDE